MRIVSRDYSSRRMKIRKNKCHRSKNKRTKQEKSPSERNWAASLRVCEVRNRNRRPITANFRDVWSYRQRKLRTALTRRDLLQSCIRSNAGQGVNYLVGGLSESRSHVCVAFPVSSRRFQTTILQLLGSVCGLTAFRSLSSTPAVTLWHAVRS